MGEAEVYLYFFCNLDARWRWVFNATPALLYPGKEIWYSLHRRVGRP